MKKEHIFYIIIVALVGFTTVFDFVLYKKVLEQKKAMEDIAQVLIYTGIVEPGQEGQGIVNKVIRFKDLPQTASSSEPSN